MLHTGIELLGLFFLYSFLGWVLETVFAAIRQKQFVNRGLINGPLCVLYGLGAILITVFGKDLPVIWLFVGSIILTTILEWTAGHLIEKLYHEKWWDYSKIKWNLDGYISAASSVLWGLLSVLMMKVGNPLFHRMMSLLPGTSVKVVLGILTILLLLDVIATLVILSGRSKRMAQWEAVDSWLTGVSSELGRRIYRRIENRIKKAYPESKQLDQEETMPDVFAHGCSFDKIVWLLVIGAFLGDLTEMVFCRVKAGIWMSRSSVVWGPFSLVWGIGIAMVTALFYRYRNKSESFLFVLGLFLGGVYEYMCSVFTEIVFGKVFWDYSHIPFNLGGRINLLYCFFWGIASVVWFRFLLPKVEEWMGKVPKKIGKVITWFMVVFMSVNMAISCMALTRSTERANGIPANHSWQKIMDERFDDERMRKIYPNMMNTD